ncbi:MAG: hypothetical protein ACOYK9_01125, partial [Chlamydiia bacterium]
NQLPEAPPLNGRVSYKQEDPPLAKSEQVDPSRLEVSQDLDRRIKTVTRVNPAPAISNIERKKTNPIRHGEEYEYIHCVPIHASLEEMQAGIERFYFRDLCELKSLGYVLFYAWKPELLDIIFDYYQKASEGKGVSDADTSLVYTAIWQFQMHLPRHLSFGDQESYNTFIKEAAVAFERLGLKAAWDLHAQETGFSEYLDSKSIYEKYKQLTSLVDQGRSEIDMKKFTKAHEVALDKFCRLMDMNRKTLAERLVQFVAEKSADGMLRSVVYEEEEPCFKKDPLTAKRNYANNVANCYGHLEDRLLFAMDHVKGPYINHLRALRASGLIESFWESLGLKNEFNAEFPNPDDMFKTYHSFYDIGLLLLERKAAEDSLKIA